MWLGSSARLAHDAVQLGPPPTTRVSRRITQTAACKLSVRCRQAGNKVQPIITLLERDHLGSEKEAVYIYTIIAGIMFARERCADWPIGWLPQVNTANKEQREVSIVKRSVTVLYDVRNALHGMQRGACLLRALGRESSIVVKSTLLWLLSSDPK